MEQVSCEEFSEQSTQQRTSLFDFLSLWSDCVLNFVYARGLSPSPHPESNRAELENAQKKRARFMKDREWVPVKERIYELKFMQFLSWKFSQDICFAHSPRQNAEPAESSAWCGTTNLIHLIFWPHCDQKHVVKWGGGTTRAEGSSEDTHYLHILLGRRSLLAAWAEARHGHVNPPREEAEGFWPQLKLHNQEARWLCIPELIPVLLYY